MRNFLLANIFESRLEQANDPSLILIIDTYFQDGRITSLSTNRPEPYHHVPCVACEAEQRPAHNMFVGMVDCPSKEMTLEYRGYLVSSAEQNDKGEVNLDPSPHRSTYECLDADAESLHKSYVRKGGAALVLVAAEAEVK